MPSDLTYLGLLRDGRKRGGGACGGKDRVSLNGSHSAELLIGGFDGNKIGGIARPFHGVFNFFIVY